MENPANNKVLSELQPGQRATVTGLCGESGLRRRLQDLGLIEGSGVRCMERSPLGDPTAYRICGAVVALRREDAGAVRISTGDEYAGA